MKVYISLRAKGDEHWLYRRTGQKIPHDRFIDIEFSSDLSRAINQGQLERLFREGPNAGKILCGGEYYPDQKIVRIAEVIEQEKPKKTKRLKIPASESKE